MGRVIDEGGEFLLLNNAYNHYIMGMRLEDMDYSWMLPGSITCLKRGKKTYHYLTWTCKGRSGALYVPVGMLKEVKEGVRNYQEAKKWLTKRGFENMKKLKQRRDVGRRRLEG